MTRSITTQRGRLTALLVVTALVATVLSTSSLVATPEVDALSPFQKIAYADFGTNYSIALDGSDKQRVGPSHAGDMSWTSDGLKQVYALGDNSLWIRNQDDRIFPLDVTGRHPAISDDGTMVAYQTGAPHQETIEVIDLDGNSIASLGDGTQPAWSPDGLQLAYLRRQSGPERSCGETFDDSGISIGFNGIWVTTLDGGGSWATEAGAIFGTTPRVYMSQYSAPDWSPDGASLVFGAISTSIQVNASTGRCSSRPRSGDVMVTSSSGGSITNLTPGEPWIGGTFAGDPFDGRPSYSPDGDFIAFASDRNSPRDSVFHSVWVMEASGANPTLVIANNQTFGIDWFTALPVGDVVTLKAPDNQADECGSDPATFSFERTGAVEGAVELTIEVLSSSTATENEDFGMLPKTIVIADNTFGVDLVIVPIVDDLTEGDETITIELVDASGGLIVGNPNRATITIKDRGPDCDTDVVEPIDDPDPVPTAAVAATPPPIRQVVSARTTSAAALNPPEPIAGEITGGKLGCAQSSDGQSLAITIPPALSVWFDRDKPLNVRGGGGVFAADTATLGQIMLSTSVNPASVQVSLSATLITGAEYSVTTLCISG